ncbi:MAG: 4Fe-4S ferredoxin, partial [Deltaproteobacteria bacterium]|nr:4Fe-4S ferredoxin [Deltaproteobacteria bacterium]
MSDKIFNRDEWTKALDGLRDSYKIFVPVRDGDFHSFKPLDEGITADFGYQNTRCSPKSLIFPQSERMFEYSLDGNNPDANILKETPKDYSPRAIVGIRPCDAHAFELVKINFDSPQYRDPWWVRRFESTVLVGLGCIEPCTTCFCESVGGGPFDDKDLDVLIYPLGETFLVRVLTDDGEAFLAAVEGGSPADDSALRDAENLASSASDKISSRVATDKLKEKVVTKLFDAPFWEDVSFACINCGTCAYLCPTCWCFDI